MNNFWQRLLTGSLFVLIIFASIFYGPLSFQLLFFLVAMLSLNEFYTIVKNDQRQPNITLGMISGAVIYIVMSGMFVDYFKLNINAVIYPVTTLIFLAELYRKKSEPFTNIAYTLIGIIYAVLPFVLLNKISTHAQQYDAGIVGGYFILLWSSDTFAYIFGNLLGKTKLFERISPKKSWEGSIGGGISALIAAWILWHYNPQLSLVNWIVIALIIVIAGTFGDLTESMLKRSLSVKDSGSLLPGHGGMLDRFDGLLLSVPFVWTYLSIFC